MDKLKKLIRLYCYEKGAFVSCDGFCDECEVINKNYGE